MKNPVERIPILDLKMTFVEMLQAAKDQRNSEMGLLAVSVIEYLKDAQRWAYAEQNQLPVNLSGKQLRDAIDEKLNER